MTDLEKPPRYKTFLLTIWEDRDVNHSRLAVWRFGLKDPHTGQRQAYSDLATLGEALHTMISMVDNAGDDVATGLTLPDSIVTGSDEQGPDTGSKAAAGGNR
jgi:hypothetical protein